jgi:hypothetical protein
MRSLNDIITTLDFLNVFASSKYQCSSRKFAFTELSEDKYFRNGKYVNYKDLLTHNYHYEELFKIEKMYDTGKYQGLAGQALSLIRSRETKPVKEALYALHKEEVEELFMKFFDACIIKGNPYYKDNRNGKRFINNLDKYVQVMNSVFDSGYSYLQLKEDYDQYQQYLEESHYVDI